MKDNDFYKNSDYLYRTSKNRQTQSKFKFMLKFFEGRMIGNILDVGERNPLTELLENKFDVPIDSTNGDLDDGFIDCTFSDYDTIIVSHVLEHLFNPLLCINELTKLMYRRSRMFVALPRRGKLLWAKGHFHEFDDYRSRKLFARAGLIVTEVHYHKVWRPWWNYLCGIRAFLRLFFEWNVIYVLKLK